MGSLQELIISLTSFIGNVILPFLFALALLFFLWNAVRFFILSDGDDAKASAKRLAIYGIAGFVLLVSIWGIVNLLVYGLGWGGGNEVIPDYMFNSDNNSSSGSSMSGSTNNEFVEPFRGAR